jgi:hypothetical protein
MRGRRSPRRSSGSTLADDGGAPRPCSPKRVADALTLWHLLSKLHGDERALVFDRFAAIVSLPASVTREGVLAEDRTMLDAAWDALGLGVTSWWRLWKSPGPPDLPDARSRSALSPRPVPRAAE